MNSIKCSRCGMVNWPTDATCKKCHSALARPSQVNAVPPMQPQTTLPVTLYLCPSCRQPVAHSAKSCPNCGGKLCTPRMTSRYIVSLAVILVIGFFGMIGLEYRSILLQVSSIPSAAVRSGAAPTIISAASQQPTADALLGQCGYNPSDMKFSGRIIAVGPEGVNAYGEPEPGQRAVTVDNPLVGPMKLTYPRWVIVRPCD